MTRAMSSLVILYVDFEYKIEHITDIITRGGAGKHLTIQRLAKYTDNIVNRVLTQSPILARASSWSWERDEN